MIKEEWKREKGGRGRIMNEKRGFLQERTIK